MVVQNLLKMILGHTKYRYSETLISEQEVEDERQNNSYDFLSAISDNFLNINIEFYPLEKLELKAGYGVTAHCFSPGKTIANQPRTGNNSYPKFETQEHNLYFLILANPFYKFNFHVGIKDNSASYPRKKLFTTGTTGFAFMEIWRETQYACSIRYNHQNFHLLTNQIAGIPVVRIPAFSSAPPESSVMFSAGISCIPENRKFQFDVQSYKKRLANLLTLKDGVNFSSSNRQSLKILFGMKGKD